jgi:hypothetical protein
MEFDRKSSWPDILACERAVLRFTAAFDDSDLGGMLAEFAPHGAWRRLDGSLVQGHDGVRALMAALRPTVSFRHIVTNLRVAIVGADQATCVSYVTVYMHDGKRGDGPAPLDPPVLVGRYHDELRRESGSWLIAARRVEVDFRKA